MIFKQVFRIAFVTLIWKQYKAVIVSTLILFAYLFLISSLHSDFLTHSRLQKDTSGSGISFVYKWLAFALGIGCYFVFHYLRGKRNIKKSDKNAAPISTKSNVADPNQENDDPFAALRDRKRLRSRADFIEGKD